MTSVALLVALSRPAAAQDKFAVGLEGGVTTSWLGPSDPGDAASHGIGAIAGGYMSIPLSKIAGLLVEGVYVQKHSQIRGLDLRLDYFEIPVLAKLPLFKGLYMTEGIGVGFPIRAALTSPTSDEADIKPLVTNPDLGLIIGGGAKIRRVGVEVRYDGGFKTVSSAIGSGIGRNRSWAVLARWQR